MKHITGILLAAGQSRRFGENKLIFPMDDGLPLILHSVRTLKLALPHVIVVVNAQDREVIALLENEDVIIVHNHSAEEGMGTSIACGVQASQQSDGWVIVLADMPYLQVQTILSVAAGLANDNSICAPRYGKRRGHPVGFSRAYATPLMQLSGDEGGRQLIADNEQHLNIIDTTDQGVVADIDYPCDVDIDVSTKQLI